MKNGKYVIATDNGQTGHAQNTLRAEINLGLKRGYAGFAQEKVEVFNFLTELYKQSLGRKENFIPFICSETFITYAFKDGDSKVYAAHEPGLSLVSDKSPLYSLETEEEWKQMVENYVETLGEKFEQYRVYVTYSRVEVKIFQKK